MPDISPARLPGDTDTCHCEAAVTGGRFVAVSGPRVNGNVQVSPTGAGGDAYGVAARDKAAGEKVMVYTGPGIVVPMTAGGAITAGDAVQSDAAGRPILLAAGLRLGMAVDDAANGATVLVKLFA